MSPIFLISLVVQVLLIVHCIKTGRNTIWVWVLILASGVGAIAYIAVEIIPDLFRSRTANRAARGVSRALDPEKDLRRYAAEAKRTGDVASAQRYGDELLRQGQGAQAIEVYRQALRGLYEHDPNLMSGLARAQFATGDASGTRATLDALIEHNPAFKSPDGHLLYARALEAEGNANKALEEYRVLAGYYAGAEAALRYAQLLVKVGQSNDARRTLENLIEHARLAPRHYQQAQEEWLGIARRELAAIQKAS